MITDEVFSIAIGIIICQILLYIISNFANKNNTEKKLWKDEDNEDLEFDIYEQLIIEELKNNDQYNLKSLCLEGKLRFNACYSELEEDIRYIELKIDYLSGYFEFGLITTIENTKKIIKDYYEKPLKCTNSEFKYIITQLRLLMRLKNDIEKAY